MPTDRKESGGDLTNSISESTRTENACCLRNYFGGIYHKVAVSSSAQARLLLPSLFVVGIENDVRLVYRRVSTPHQTSTQEAPPWLR